MRKRFFEKFRRRNDSGQALIELALSLSLLMAMLLCATELGQVAFAAIEMTNAARAASQYAAMNGGHYLAGTGSGLDETGMLRAAQQDAGSLSSSIGFASGYPKVSCQCSGAGTASCSGTGYPPASGCAPPSSVVLVTITVRTQAAYTPPIWGSMMIWGSGIGAGHNSITLSGWSSQQVVGAAN